MFVYFKRIFPLQQKKQIFGIHTYNNYYFVALSSLERIGFHAQIFYKKGIPNFLDFYSLHNKGWLSWPFFNSNYELCLEDKSTYDTILDTISLLDFFSRFTFMIRGHGGQISNGIKQHFFVIIILEWVTFCYVLAFQCMIRLILSGILFQPDLNGELDFKYFGKLNLTQSSPFFLGFCYIKFFHWVIIGFIWG